jgi:hypothetical protein
MRVVQLEGDAGKQLKAIGVSFIDFDEMMEFFYDTLCTVPEMFPVLPGTRLSICLTNEFVGSQYPHVPALALFFTYDLDTVRIYSIEESMFDTYGA